MEPAVFLDRDETLIANDGDLGDPAEVRLLPGVAAGLRALRSAGFRLVVVTNQGGVARGRFTEDDVDRVNQRIADLVDAEAGGRDLIDRFYYCPYHPEATIETYRREHFWRKPNPGMLLQAARDLQLDLAASWMVGDQARDVEAGRSAGCRTVLIARNGEATPESGPRPTAVVRTFAEAVDRICDAPSARRSRAAAPAGEAERDAALLAAVRELTDELRTERAGRVEFTPARLGAALCLLLAVLLALLGLLNLASLETFAKWMIGAALVELLSIALLLSDRRG